MRMGLFSKKEKVDFSGIWLIFLKKAQFLPYLEFFQKRLF